MLAATKSWVELNPASGRLGFQRCFAGLCTTAGRGFGDGRTLLQRLERPLETGEWVGNALLRCSEADEEHTAPLARGQQDRALD